MTIDAAGLAKLTKEQLAAELTARILRKEAVYWNLCFDMSPRFAPGVKTLAVPRSVGIAVNDTPSDGSEIADASRTMNEDKISLDQFKTASDYVYDVHQQHSMVSLKEEFYVEALPSLVDYIETATANLYISSAANQVQMTGGAVNDEIEIDNLGQIAQEMDEANVPRNGRVAVLSPKQARILRSTQPIRDASAYGNNDSVRRGFVGEVEGFQIFQSNDNGANQSIITIDQMAMARVLANQFSRGEERQESKKRDFVSIDASFGIASRRAGQLIWLLDDQ